LNPKN